MTWLLLARVPLLALLVALTASFVWLQLVDGRER